MFTDAQYAAAAARLHVALNQVKAMALVEASGQTFWTIRGEQRPPVRFEAHRFGFHSNYRFNASHPRLSCYDWTPGLAATTWLGAWEQLELARVLDREAANKATSWGAFQVMGENADHLDYPSVDAFVESMYTTDGQLEAFCRFIMADSALHASLAIGAWLDVERRYNGGGYNGAYAAKMKATAELLDGPAARRVGGLLHVGAAGDDVRTLQLALCQAGYVVSVDSAYGPQTRASVEAFQRSKSLVADGIVGPLTRQALGISPAA